MSGDPQALVVMGVSGSGKTTIARRLADRLGWAFAEADDFHPAANIAKMHSGHPLTDADRWPWLEAVRDWASEHGDAGQDAVLTCSALKRSYRDLLRGARTRVRFLQLDADPDLLAKRLGSRTGHFMPASLLSTQLAALQPLQPDEDGVVVPVDGPPEDVVRAALERLGLPAAASRGGGLR